MLHLTWYVHAAFLLEGTADDGAVRRIVLDPYCALDVGTYEPIDDSADLVAISHENAKYHSHIAGVGGEPEIVDGLRLLDEPQPQIVCGVPFSAVRVWENEQREEPIAMVGLTLGGVRVLHMGDCGHALGPDEVSACGRVDVLLALAGGPPTLAIEDLADFIEALAPRIVIPMHFGNNKINLNLRPVEDLLARVRGRYPVHALDTPTVTIRPDALPATTQVWVLPPAR